MKELYKKEIGKKVVSITCKDEEEMKIDFGGEFLTIGTFHSSDCCECVYGDFSSIKYHEKDLVEKKIKSISIKTVEGMGFLLIFEIGYKEYKKIFIPCYNYQNGYYSSNLELLINDNGTEIKTDISDLVEDHID